MKYHSYSKYKSTGIDWLGDVPEHWEKIRLKDTVNDCVNGYWGDEPDGINDIPVVRVADFNRLNFRINFPIPTERAVEQKALVSRLLKKGDLLLEKSGGGDSQPVGAVSLFESDIRAISANFITKMTPKSKYNSYYLVYVFASFYSKRVNYRHINQTTGIQNINSSSYLCEKFYCPELTEQIAIVKFINHETNRIDILIKEKDSFIDLLKEKRLSLIINTITKGLNPAAKLKDTGVNWMEKVPEHWVIKKVKHLFEIRKRIAGKEGYQVLSITQQGIKVKDTESGEGQLSMDYSKYQFVEIGDFAMNHMDLLTGYIDLSSEFGVTSPDYRVFSLTDKNSVDKYYLYLMQMGYKLKIFFALGQGVANVGRWRLQTEVFSNFPIPYPPKNEQKEIVEFLDTRISRIDALIEETKNSINLLKEHRIALISAAVTGKIDVRHLAKDAA